MLTTGDLLHRVPTFAALGLLTIAALHDLGFRTLPDTISVALLGCGTVLHLAVGDLGLAMLAALTVFALTLLLWRAGTLGGGDAKLLGATTLAVPFSAIPMLLLCTALAGGVLALGFLALRPVVPSAPGRRPAALLARVLRAEAWRIRRRGPLPYAAAIATGGAVSLLSG
jgi:prepilin peptidase CpaA